MTYFLKVSCKLLAWRQTRAEKRTDSFSLRFSGQSLLAVVTRNHRGMIVWLVKLAKPSQTTHTSMLGMNFANVPFSNDQAEVKLQNDALDDSCQ